MKYSLLNRIFGLSLQDEKNQIMTTNVWLVQVITPAFCRTVCDDVNRDVWKFITETTLLIVSDL